MNVGAGQGATLGISRANSVASNSSIGSSLEHNPDSSNNTNTNTNTDNDNDNDDDDDDEEAKLRKLRSSRRKILRMLRLSGERWSEVRMACSLFGKFCRCYVPSPPSLTPPRPPARPP